MSCSAMGQKICLLQGLNHYKTAEGNRKMLTIIDALVGFESVTPA
jgi:hypothetical protein